ncbi:MAG: thiamine-binding protein [Sediminibacterium sp.]|nr:thiamine-binding protein [Sediminibacterium sp.]
MHDFIVSASIQILPIGTQRHPYAWVDEAIAIIQKSGIDYRVQAFDTVVEGKYAAVMAVIDQINHQLCNAGCEEWITHLQIQIRSNTAITVAEKLEKYPENQ